MRVLIRGGLVVDPGQGIEARRQVLIENGRLVDLVDPGQEGEYASAERVIEAAGCLVTPGLIDLHVHLREPGQEYKETIASGTAAAAAGGFTAVAAMPNTNPVNDDRAVTEFILGRAREAGPTRVWPVAAMTKGSRGEELTEYADLAEAGARAVSDDGRWVSNSKVMRRVLEYAQVFGLTAISHAEDPSLSSGGLMNEGRTATALGLAGHPAAAEEIAVFRDVKLAELTGAPVHIAHVSTAGAVEIIRRAKKSGLKVTAETAPHYFHLTEEAIQGYRTEAKVNPPLRTAADVAAIRAALSEGVLEAIATDHAPHSSIEKDLEFDQASFGIVGLETALALSLELVRDKVLTLSRMVAALSLAPARILNVPGGVLKKGRPVDLTIIDPGQSWVCDPARFKSKGRYTPFAGRNMTGRAVLTMAQGRVTHDLTSL
ncbi:MAG: dihydroorotase [Thermodesulfobacteriota bacterium]